ncbi:hypothetical protein B0H16DRAFT_1462280 [Mycena metata]|uniref:Uncharacterized protein n=1 Tax=Mycena metata TaxID=1033252 RepID=A0AAD7INB8_9AGAR|nr:hypothetical protein B0H16DRAFT_1462280 [Mycena metata]
MNSACNVYSRGLRLIRGLALWNGNTIKVMEAFLKTKWPKLWQEILKHYDAERTLQKYKPADIKDYAMKMRNKGCYNLTQRWKEEDQYTIKEWNHTAEWYFRRNKYETLMISVGELGEDMDEGDSGDEWDNESSSSSDDKSDCKEYQQKRKLRAKKKNKKSPDERERNKYQGNEEEIAGMIRKLNTMRLDDPEYAPIYYKVMVMDRSGTAEFLNEISKEEWKHNTATDRGVNS